MSGLIWPEIGVEIEIEIENCLAVAHEYIVRYNNPYQIKSNQIRASHANVALALGRVRVRDT